MPEISDVYLEMRRNFTALNPADFEIMSAPDHPRVWGFVIDQMHPQIAVSIVGAIDGHTSMYTGVGGGWLGMGEYPAVADATRDLIAAVEYFLPQFTPTDDYPLPEISHFRITALTFQQGAFMVDVAEQELIDNPRHPLMPIFGRIQRLQGLMQQHYGTEPPAAE